MRLAIMVSSPPNPEDFVDFLVNFGISDPNQINLETNSMLTLRVFSNLFTTKQGLKMIKESKFKVNIFFNFKILESARDVYVGNQNMNLHLAFATLLLKYRVK